MAANTDISLRNQVMYQIFVRNFSKEGTFRAVIGELDRIRAMGVDIIWFAPIHPVGKVKRKGTMGSPYAISDYRAVNPEYGTMQDFKELVDEIHLRGMKCIIDVVYNHTSPDSLLAKEHPEWFYHKEDGSFGNRVGDWTDVIDLDYSNRGLWDYQIESLKMWVGIVDGFRCDVAPLVPLDFWKEARKAVAEVRADAIWLCESVEAGFIKYMRGRGLCALSDSELYQAFDISYDYDIFDEFTAYFNGNGTLKEYAAAVNRQEFIYPANYVKLRFLENHDKPRAASYLLGEEALRNATAFLFFQKGLTLIYAGQEYGAAHLPGLFEKDDVDWENPDKTDISDLIKTLAKIKRDPLFKDSSYNVTAVNNEVLIAEHRKGDKRMLGVFSFTGKPEKICVPVTGDNPFEGAGVLADGRYTDLISGKETGAQNGCIEYTGEPLIFCL